MCSRPIWRLLVSYAVMFITFGCSTVQKIGGSSASKPPVGSVSKVAVLWSEAVLRENGLPVAQGFAGKVYLFGPDSRAPVTAPGKFTIFAYDETSTREVGTQQESSKPDRSWEFNESELRSLLKKDAIGWSYSLWAPYGPPTGSERRVTLRIGFTPESGRQVLSESALITLPTVGPAGSNRTRLTSQSGKIPDEPEKKTVSVAYCPPPERP